MSRSPVTIRDAMPSDAPALVELLTIPDIPTRAEIPCVEPVTREAAVAEARAAVARTAADPDERLVVGLIEQDTGDTGQDPEPTAVDRTDGAAPTGGVVAGVVHLRRAPVSPVRVQESVQVTALSVAPEHRRKGVATALVSAATAWAEEKDAPFVVTAMPARDREANRYVTRLGFSQMAVLRVAGTGALRGRFAGMAAGSRDTGRMIAVRRTLRRREATPSGGRARRATAS